MSRKEYCFVINVNMCMTLKCSIFSTQQWWYHKRCRQHIDYILLELIISQRTTYDIESWSKAYIHLLRKCISWHSWIPIILPLSFICDGMTGIHTFFFFFFYKKPSLMLAQYWLYYRAIITERLKSRTECMVPAEITCGTTEKAIVTKSKQYMQ